MAANFTRTVSLVEIWAHPTEGGARRVYLQYRTADGGALTTITTVDTTRYLCRKKGGGATRSFDATTGEITTDGDYFFIPFTAAITMTDLKVWVTDSNDQYARICEVKAYREVDWTDRATALSVSQDADAALRRFRARTLTLGLSNTDGYLSYYGSDGGYNTEVGAGVVLRVYVGYEGTEKISQGVFYVDKWDEDPAKAAIKVSARDGAGIMSTEVRARLKTGQTHERIIEYLANLCRIPSTDIILDQVAQRVSYFLPDGGTAWEECQKVAEAGSFSSVFFDANGYLNFVSHTNIPGLTGNDTQLSTMTRVLGPGYIVGDIIYYVATTNSSDYIRIAAYDIATGAWTYSGIPLPAGAAGTPVGQSEITVGFCGNINIAGGTTEWLHVSAYYPPSRVYGHRTTSSGVSIPSIASPASISSGITEARATCISMVEFSSRYCFCWAGIDSTPNQGVWWMVNGSPELIAGSSPGANLQIWALAVEAGVLLALVRDTSAGGLKLYEVVLPASGSTVTYTLRATFGGSSDLRPTGMTATGNGYVWINYAAATDGATGKFTKITVPGYVVTTTGDAWASELVPATTWARDAVTYDDGLVIAAVQRPGTIAGTEKQNIVTYSEATGVIENLGPMGLSGSLVTNLRAYEWSQGTIILGTMDNLRIVEIRPSRRGIARQDTSVVTIKNSDMLSAFSLSIGDVRGGGSIIVNRVSIKSEPLVAGSTETVWKSPGVPFRVRANDELKHRVHLSKDVNPDTLAASVTHSGSAATVYLDGTNGSVKHHRTPTIVVRVTTGGTITALSITGTAFTTGSLINESFGPARSLKRYSFRRLQIDNPYIYDSVAQSMIADDVLRRYSFPDAPPITLSGIKSLALWHLEPLDRITVVHSTAGINTDFYVVRFSHDYRAQTTSLDLVAVPA